MIFFKKKQEELLPPPPPFPSMELEEPKLFDEIEQPKEETKAPEVEEFDELFEGLEKEKSKQVKKAKAMPKQKAVTQKQAKAIKKKTLKTKKLQLKPAEKLIPSAEKEMPEQGIELPETLEGLKQGQFEFPDKTEDFGEAGFGAVEIGKLEIKPKEIIEAEEEIKTAIEKIKTRENPSFLRRLFTKEAKKEELPEAARVKGIEAVQTSLNEARNALARFDLQAAKKNYINVMRIYNTLKPEEQAKVYHDVRELYFERKSAEELKV